jgi:hypothetical protein
VVTWTRVRPLWWDANHTITGTVPDSQVSQSELINPCLRWSRMSKNSKDTTYQRSRRHSVTGPSALAGCLSRHNQERERERERARERERQRDRERERQRQRQRDRDRETETEREYSTSCRNRIRVNRNHLDICLSVPQKNRNSLTWVLVALTVCFTYPVLYRVSAESRDGEWEL